MPSEDSKPVKKEDDHSDEDKISSFKKATNSNAKPQSKVSKLKKTLKPEPMPHATSKVKNEVNDDDSDSGSDDEKPIGKKISKTKVQNSKKFFDLIFYFRNVCLSFHIIVACVVLGGEGSEEDKEGKEGRESGCYRGKEEDKERKVYDLPGQKRDPPE
jgi:hypothetical protein